MRLPTDVRHHLVKTLHNAIKASQVTCTYMFAYTKIECFNSPSVLHHVRSNIFQCQPVFFSRKMAHVRVHTTQQKASVLVESIHAHAYMSTKHSFKVYIHTPHIVTRLSKQGVYTCLNFITNSHISQ